MGNESARNIKWIDGLRGLASFMVILTHLSRAWAPELFLPRDDFEESVPRVLQWPILRVPWQGRIGVTIFAFLTGFVCALKPLRLARAGQQSAALSSIAKSAFRRAPRLIIPATFAMFIAWLLCQLGAFKVATVSDAEWLRYASPVPDPSLMNEIQRFFRVWLNTWTNGHMDYDDHQWAILPLLKGSMMVYVVLCATIYAKYQYRLVVYAALLFYWHMNPNPDTETFGLQFFYGMILSDASSHPPVQNFISSRRWIGHIISPILIILGLYLASFPADHAEWVGWSNELLQLAEYIFPPGTNLPKRFTALGIDVCIFAIFLSPPIRDILSNVYLLWFGKVSFAVYLIHGTLLRTILTWMVYGISSQQAEPEKNAEGEELPPPWIERRSWPVFAISVPIWMGIVYSLAYLWTVHVDGWCARVTQRLEQRVFEESEKSAPLLPQ